jgi:magnesium transporter
VARRRAERKRQRAVGAPPGTIVIDPAAPSPRLHAMTFDLNGFEEFEVSTLTAAVALRQPGRTLWLNVDGLGSETLLRELASDFGLHALALEDVVNTGQRPKVDEYDDHIYVVAHMALPSQEGLGTEQFSLFLGEDFVLTFQEGHPGDCFEPVRSRLRQNSGRIRRAGPCYLAYALLDAVVDAWFPVLDRYGAALHALEEEVLTRPHEDQMMRIRKVKWELLTLLRAVMPLRDVFTSLMREGNAFVRPETRLFLRDCHDHAMRIVEEAETYREIDASLMEMYHSSVSNRTNEVMKFLTVVSAIFIPLTFLVGVYGMNFEYMPELKWHYGYFGALAFMILVSISMVLYFRYRGWFGRVDRTGKAAGLRAQLKGDDP